MKRNKLFLLLLIVLFAFSLISCDNGQDPTPDPTPEHQHVFGEQWLSDENNHWHVCECGEKSSLAAHTWDAGTVVEEATEESKGKKIYTCTVCSKTKEDEIEKLQHTHSYGEWTVVTEPTTNSEGVEERICSGSNCGTKETRSILMTPTLLFGNAMLSWEEIPYAIGYKLFINDDTEGVDLGDTLVYTLPSMNIGTYAFSIAAYTDEEDYAELSYKSEIKFLKYYSGANDTPLGNFEQFTETTPLTSGSGWVNGVFVEASSLQSSVVREENNSYYKAINVGKPCIEFDLYANDAFKQVGLYQVSMKVKLGAGATNVNAIGFRFWGAPERPTEKDYEFNLTGINSDGWTTIYSYVDITKVTTHDWINMFFWVFTHDDELNAENNYVLIDDIEIRLISVEAVCYHNGLEHVSENEETCTEAGNVEYWYCADCDKYFADVNCTNVINNVTIAPKGHSYSDLWSSDENKHWHAASCEHSTEVKDENAHTFEWIVDKDATLEAAGTKHEECNVCHYKRNEGTEIPKLTCNHEGIETVEAKEATCVATGNIKYYHCDTCGKYYSDEAYQIEIELEDIVVSVSTEHKFGEYSVSKEASTTEEGEVKRVCTVNGCEASETLKVLKTPVVKAEGLVLSWEAVDNAEGYKLYKDGVETLDLGNVLSVDLAGKSFGNYAVLAYTYNELYAEVSNVSTELEFSEVLSNDLLVVQNNDFEDCEVLTHPANASFGLYPYGNYGQLAYQIVRDGNTMCAKLQPTQFGQTIILKKDVSGNVAKGTYTVSFDVKNGSSEHVEAGRLFVYLCYDGGALKIVDDIGQCVLSAANKDGWTTFSFEYTLDVTSWAQLDIGYWPEVSLENNYVLIDNIRIVAKENPSVNLDTIAGGDFEMFSCGAGTFVAGQWCANNTVFVEGTGTECSIVTENGNKALKVYSTAGECVEFDLNVNGALNAAGRYKVSMKVKLGAGATNLGAIGFRFWGDPRPTSADFNLNTTGVNSDGWTTISTYIDIPADTNSAWCNMFFWVFVNNNIVNSVDNYVLIDDVQIQGVTYQVK